MKTVQELCEEAVFVQDACNLTAVVHSYSRAMTALREVIPGQSTDFYNRHPVSVMFASKIASLTRCEDYETFSKAHDFCTDTK